MIAKRKLSALIFDMDGLMIDTERLYFETEREQAGLFGKDLKDETLWKMMGRSPLDAIKIFVEDLKIPIKPEEMLARRDVIMLEKMKHDLVALPGLFDILDRFDGVMDYAIATGAQKEFLDIAIDTLDIRTRFNVLQPSDEIVLGKPHPEIYLTTARKLKIPASECVVLEDSSNGSRSGIEAGCMVIAVPSEYTKGQDFSFVDYIATDLSDAANYIEGIRL